MTWKLSMALGIEQALVVKKNLKLQAKRLIEIADIKSRRNDLRKVIGYRNKYQEIYGELISLG